MKVRYRCKRSELAARSAKRALQREPKRPPPPAGDKALPNAPSEAVKLPILASSCFKIEDFEYCTYTRQPEFELTEKYFEKRGNFRALRDRNTKL